MIPHSTLSDDQGLSDEYFGDLKNRVAACRKRMRLHRSMHKSKDFRNPPAEIFADTDTASSQPRQYTEGYSAAVGAIIGESEVGIT